MLKELMQSGSSLMQAVGLPIGSARGKASSEFMRGERNPFFFSWRPALRDTRDEVRQSYIAAAARAVDTIHNSGWIAGAIKQAISSTMGNGLRLAAKPDAEALGWDKEEADKWSRLVERNFEAWGNNPMECDAGGRMTLGEMARAVLNNHFSHGEALVLLPMIDRPFSKTRTKVKLMPPHKLTQDGDGLRLFQGVFMDNWSLPIGYRILMRVGEAWEQNVDIPARDGAGRPQVVHIFEGGPDQVRGITPLAPVLKVLRQYDQLADATLTAALIQAIFAATIESEAPTEQILNALQDEGEQGVGGGSIDGYLDAKTEWYQNTKIDLGRAGRIAHLFPGEKLEFHGSKTPNDTYEAFAKFLLREIARCLGMTFETLTGDYSGATYSSVRMATSELWPVVLARRSAVPGKFYQAVYEAWLEEEIESGRVSFPGGIYGYLENREAVTRADWRGPAKPQADDLKAAKAHETYKRLGLMTDEQICAELGQDWEDVYEQRKREAELRKKYDLPEGDTLETAQDEALTNALITDGSGEKQAA